ncbi:sulfite exporter TauE/SafE family protein [Alicyclobacillus fastidiosus]|uniref:Nickel/cobalt efflux system n=1 Tax=Alicyclobacillus fastidiosus TaxID=392011 RepID=A0ABY6ZKM4_9BACL|nr:sulfite exporter TauE/SafE family protein [Alicyclobacillus fastidiosus]WAH43470.1 sulfite exporter TauE/SafE family protein [Alicyclobacillus fastidiosus]GMA59628.1 nickel/cobalt efflux system [Alicyclobacillus fastidiosus]
MQLVYAIPVAMGLGALHSLEPGHGKGVISAYLISNQGKPKDAMLIGFVSAVAHTFSILMLALVATSSIDAFIPEHLISFIELGSGLAVSWIGARMLYQKFRPEVVVVRKLGLAQAETCTNPHHHHHVHSNHSHKDSPPSSIGRLFTVGFFTGLIPCPSALAILLSSIGLHHASIGMTLVMAFSIGMALMMCTIGLVVVTTGDTISRLDHWRVTDTLTSLSSLLVFLIGCFVSWEAVSHLLR